MGKVFARAFPYLACYWFVYKRFWPYSDPFHTFDTDHSVKLIYCFVVATLEHLPEWQVDMVYAWDDTSQQVVPSDPRVVDDLQRKGHFILGLTKAFRTKLGLLQNAVNGPLLEKRDTLVKQQAKIQARVDEVKMASGTIEQETKLSSDEIVERLKSTERFKLSLLLRDKVDLGKDIESIQGLIEEVAERGKASSMIDFLGKEKHLRDRCELLINKPFKEVSQWKFAAFRIALDPSDLLLLTFSVSFCDSVIGKLLARIHSDKPKKGD